MNINNVSINELEYLIKELRDNGWEGSDNFMNASGIDNRVERK